MNPNLILCILTSTALGSALVACGEGELVSTREGASLDVVDGARIDAPRVELPETIAGLDEIDRPLPPASTWRPTRPPPTSGGSAPGVPRPAPVAPRVGTRALLQDLGFHRFAEVLRAGGVAARVDGSDAPLIVLVPAPPALDVYLDRHPELGFQHPVYARAFGEQYILRGTVERPEALVARPWDTLRAQAALQPRGARLASVTRAEVEPTGRFWPYGPHTLVEVSGVLPLVDSVMLHLEDAGFERFVDAARLAGLDELDRHGRRAVVFAPTDDALERVGLTRERMADAKDGLLAAIVRAHLADPASVAQVMDRTLTAEDGASLAVQQRLDPSETRYRPTVVRNGVEAAHLSDEVPERDTPQGAIIPLGEVLIAP